MNKFLVFCAYLVLAILAAGLFGAIHDQISYTVSPEYFTCFKFPMFHLLDANIPERIRASQVGFLASWWMGIPLGLLTGLAGFIHADAAKMRSALVWSLPVIMGFVLLFALCGLFYGYIQTQAIDLAGYRGWYIPEGVQDLRGFLCAGYMHNSAYLGGVFAIPVAWLFHMVVRRRHGTA
jgi:hypothetical protein